MLFRLCQQRVDQTLTPALPLPRGCYSDRTDFSKVQAVKVKGAASDDLAVVFEYHEITYVLADLRQGSGQKCPIRRIGHDQIVDLLCIRQCGVTRAHGFPRTSMRFG